MGKHTHTHTHTSTRELDDIKQSINVSVSSVQSLSHVRLFATPWIAARQASLSITNSWSSLRLTSIASVMPFSHLILCRPLYLLPPIPPSIRVFSNESTLCIRWPKYWSFSFSINPSKEIPGLISFRMDWLDLLAATSKFRGEKKLPHFSELWDSLLANDRTVHLGFNSDICFPCPVPMEDASTVMRKQEQIFSCCAC